MSWTRLKIKKGHRLSPISFSEENWRPQLAQSGNNRCSAWKSEMYWTSAFHAENKKGRHWLDPILVPNPSPI
jgi:hypothetical protein